GVSPAQARQDVQEISAQLSRQYPLSNGGRSLHLESLVDHTLGFARTGLALLLAGAAMFLLIGCSNVANLLLARLLSRRTEMAVRTALGAGRGRLLGQLVMESCVLGVAGGLAGYALAVLAWKLLSAVAPASIPRLAHTRADWTVLAFTFAISILSGFIFGIVPALAATRRDPSEALRQAGTRGSIGHASNRLRSGLVVGEVAIAVMLVVVGGLLAGAFVRLLRTDPGFDAGHVVASIIIPSGDRYKTPEARELLFRGIVNTVSALPGVESAGTVDALPFTGENHGGLIGVDESVALARDRGLPTEVDVVSPGYLSTMGVRLLEGRWLQENDMLPDHDTAVISSTAQSQLWPGQSALGKKVCMNVGNGKARCRQVIGVVSPLLHSGLSDQFTSQLYSATGALGRADFLVVRTSRPPAEIAGAIQRAVSSVDPKQPVFLSAAMTTLIGDSVADRRFILTLLGVTGCLALFLAAAGVYGVISYATSQRTQEIGVRMALGATPSNVRGLIFRQGMLLAGIGIAIGLASALAVARILRSRQVGLSSMDPELVAMAVALVVAVAALACWIPARRATRIDPLVALRQP
ncbi:MAG: FtsX-like permease family protein, partial [Bryobacteraceae bacterium]